ncbi:MAG: type I-B CRISPR-associated protein Cas7/Cst2/DevR [Candidatus Lokiarchaeota archaeon]|nr:type I-B CRISPR-associated protein Cas7/Cst2/DevR [Candidatus Lokiarchaeota archaeon]
MSEQGKLKYKSLNLVWLSKTSLANLNAGEGSSNIVELKTYSSGQKPYVSGQAMRHALRAALERSNHGVILCTPEAPCGNIAECWLCDLFGFLNPKEGEGSDRRWSPIKMSPALGQIRNEIVTDLLTRSSEMLKDSGTKDQRMAYIQLAENVYKLGLALDIENIGRTEKPKIVEKTVQEIIKEDHYDINEKKRRIRELIKSIWNISDLAKQARNLASLSPEFIIGTLQSHYNHRLQDAIEMDDDGNIDCERLKTILIDFKDDNTEIYIGYISSVVKNDDELKKTLEDLEIQVTSPGQVKKDLLEKFN